MRFTRLITTALLFGLSFTGAAPSRAQGEGRPLIVGNTRLLMVRTGDTLLHGQRMTISQRINHVQDIFARHLGGQAGRVTWKPIRDRAHLYLNGDFVLAVTPTDARLNGYKSAAQLAPVWARALSHGFAEAHVRPAPARP